MITNAYDIDMKYIKNAPKIYIWMNKNAYDIITILIKRISNL